jgi:hypothetical protein
MDQLEHDLVLFHVQLCEDNFAHSSTLYLATCPELASFVLVGIDHYAFKTHMP